MVRPNAAPVAVPAGPDEGRETSSDGPRHEEGGLIEERIVVAGASGSVVRAVVDDRDRIARDLHDMVIRRLFAIGLGLQALHSCAKRDPVLSERLLSAIDQLDATIADIRSTIFAIQH